MANLKEVRTRIASVKSTQQITKAMKVVSAAKLRKAQGRIQQMRPYANKLEEIMGNLSSSTEGSSAAKYFEDREAKKILFVVVSADRGLCGGFNSTIYKKVISYINTNFSDLDSSAIDLLTIGKKAKELFKKQPYKVVEKHDGFFTSFEWSDSEKIASKTIESFLNGTYDKVFICYNEFKNAAVYLSTVQQLLPIVENPAEEQSVTNTDYIFEPSQSGILDELIPQSLKISFYKALLDSNASEHGSRMTAMDNATENAQELLRSLSIEYNKARQATITNEILEIVGGAEALANG